MKDERRRSDAGPRGRDRRRQRFLPLAIGTSGGVAIAALAFWFFKEQAEHVVEGRADALDETILQVVHKIDDPRVHTVMHAATQLGTHAAIGAAAGISAIVMMRRGRKHDAWTIAISTGGAMAINTLLKNVFQRQRPQERARRIKLPKSHSFPSGHSLLSVATYPIIAHHLVERRSARVQVAAHALSGLLILTVGFSRVYFGVHFPSDVFGGFAAGLGWLGLTSLSHTAVDRSDRLQEIRDSKKPPQVG